MSDLQVPCSSCGRPLLHPLTIEETIVAAKLTMMEAAILRCIAARKGQLIKAREIAAEVYRHLEKEQPASAVKTVHVMICHIRRKLEIVQARFEIDGLHADARVVAKIGTEHGSRGGINIENASEEMHSHA